MGTYCSVLTFAYAHVLCTYDYLRQTQVSGARIHAAAAGADPEAAASTARKEVDELERVSMKRKARMLEEEGGGEEVEVDGGTGSGQWGKKAKSAYHGVGGGGGARGGGKKGKRVTH